MPFSTIIHADMPNAELEERHLLQLLSLIAPTATNVTAQNPPEPDFSIELHNEIIGIEHTQLVRKPDSSGINIMAHTRFANEIMKRANAIFREKYPDCLMVQVNFKCTYGLTSVPVQLHKQDIEELSLSIATFVANHLPKLQEGGHMTTLDFEEYDWDTMKRNLPEKIITMSITNTIAYKDDCWSAVQGGAVPGIFDSAEFTEILGKKNKKPANYRNQYHQLWLLIVEDGADLTTYFHAEDRQEKKLTTAFNKIFVLRSADNEYFEVMI